MSSCSPVCANLIIQPSEVGACKFVSQLYTRDGANGDTRMHGLGEDPMRRFVYPKDVRWSRNLQEPGNIISCR
jgi:hypothetical protein